MWLWLWLCITSIGRWCGRHTGSHGRYVPVLALAWGALALTLLPIGKHRWAADIIAATNVNARSDAAVAAVVDGGCRRLTGAATVVVVLHHCRHTSKMRPMAGVLRAGIAIIGKSGLSLSAERRADSTHGDRRNDGLQAREADPKETSPKVSQGPSIAATRNQSGQSSCVFGLFVFLRPDREALRGVKNRHEIHEIHEIHVCMF